MQHKHTFAALLLSLTLTACGGGGGSSAPADQTAAYTAPASPAAPAVNMAGKWVLSATSNIQATQYPTTLNLTQNGSSITGTYATGPTPNNLTGWGPVTGTVSGNDFYFTLTPGMTGCSGNILGKGTLDINNPTSINYTYIGNYTCRGNEAGSGTAALDYTLKNFTVVPEVGRVLIYWHEDPLLVQAYGPMQPPVLLRRPAGSLASYATVATGLTNGFPYSPGDNASYEYAIQYHYQTSLSTTSASVVAAAL